MRIWVSSTDKVVQAEGPCSDVYELLGLLLRKTKVQRITLCTTRENASLCWGVGEDR